MKLTERRNFLKTSLQALAFTSLFINQSSKASLDQLRLPKISPSLSNELQEIYLSWKKKYHQEPDEFFLSSGDVSITAVNKINQNTRIDFSQDNTIEVHGLILGKTEAAFLATLYSYNKA